MIGPRGKDLDGDYQGQDSYFDPNVIEVRENPPHFFPAKTVAERLKLAEERGPSSGWEGVVKRSIESGWAGEHMMTAQQRRAEILKILDCEASGVTSTKPWSDLP